MLPFCCCPDVASIDPSASVNCCTSGLFICTFCTAARLPTGQILHILCFGNWERCLSLICSVFNFQSQSTDGTELQIQCGGSRGQQNGNDGGMWFQQKSKQRIDAKTSFKLQLSCDGANRLNFVVCMLFSRSVRF